MYRSQSVNLLRKKNEIGFSSVRGGDVVGEHSVYFFMDGFLGLVIFYLICIGSKFP